MNFIFVSSFLLPIRKVEGERTERKKIIVKKRKMNRTWKTFPIKARVLIENY